MMKHLSVVAFAVIVLVFGAGSLYAEGNAFAPPAGKTLLFIGQDNDTIKTYMEKVGHKPDGFMLYTSVQEAKSLDVSADYGAGPGYADGLLKEYPEAKLQIGLYMVGASEAVVKGVYDANIEKIGLWIKKVKVPVYLRIGYEFDLAESKYEPEAYKRAFRYIVDKFRALGVDNAAYVWHSQCRSDAAPDISPWYPGDNYVDWVGVSIFSTQQVPRAKEIRAFAREHQKPFMIAESTPQGLWTPAGRMDWFTKIFRLIDQEDVEAFSYINSNWDAMPMYKGQLWGDSRLEAMTPQTRQMFLENVQGERYQRAK